MDFGEQERARLLVPSRRGLDDRARTLEPSGAGRRGEERNGSDAVRSHEARLGPGGLHSGRMFDDSFSSTSLSRDADLKWVLYMCRSSRSIDDARERDRLDGDRGEDGRECDLEESRCG